MGPIQTDGEVKSGLEFELSQADVWVLSVPEESLGEVTELLTEYSLASMWFTQPAQLGSFQARSSAEIDSQRISELASALSRLVDAFEISHFSDESSLFIYVRGIGMKCLAIDNSGEITLRVGQVQRMVRQANGNMAEFERLLRLEQGVSLLDALEPFRRSIASVEMLPRAV